MLNFKITDNPFFYRLRKGAKTFYILGTNHLVPLSALPQACRDIIAKTDHLFKEVLNYFPTDTNCSISQDTQLSLADLKTLGIIDKRPKKQRWFMELTPSERSRILDFWDEIKDQYPSSINISQLKITEVYYQLNLFSQKKGMDHTIEQNHFDGQHTGKFAYALDERSEEEEEDNLLNSASIGAIRYLLENQSFEPSSYSHYYNGILNEFIIDDQSKIAERNAKWIEKTHGPLQSLEGQILIAVGCDHLGTKTGLLRHFAEQGYYIDRMNANGSFETCPYSNLKKLKAYQNSRQKRALETLKIEEQVKKINQKLLTPAVVFTDSVSQQCDELNVFLAQLENSSTLAISEFKLLTRQLEVHKQRYRQHKKTKILADRLQEVLDTLISEDNFDEYASLITDRISSMLNKIYSDQPLDSNELSLAMTLMNNTQAPSHHQTKRQRTK